MANHTETLLKSDNKAEATQAATLAARFMEELTVDERRDVLAFMQGVRFAKGLDKTALTTHYI